MLKIEKETLFIFVCCRGEAAFYGLANTFFWAKSPMRYRLHALSPDLPLTAIYGADSWMRPLTTEEFEEARGRQGLTLSTVSQASLFLFE